MFLAVPQAAPVRLWQQGRLIWHLALIPAVPSVSQAPTAGVTGLKPTYGTVSRYGLVAYASSLDQIGPVGKDVADCAALLEVIAGHDPKDSTSIDRHDLDFGKEMTDKIAGMKFGVPKEYLAEGLSPDVKDAF